MAAKKQSSRKAARTSSRAARAAAPAAPRCPTCDRELQPGEELTAQHPSCIRCEHEAAYPGRDYDVDSTAAAAKGMRLYTYMLGQQPATS